MNNYKTLYQQTLTECISLLNKSSELETAKLSLAIHVGQSLDTFLKEAKDEHSSITCLARDITKQRKRLTTPTTLESFRQLYLAFGSAEEVQRQTAKIAADLSTEVLLATASDRMLPQVGQESVDEVARALDRLVKTIDNAYKRMKETLQDREISEELKCDLLEALSVFKDRNDEMTMLVQNHQGADQLQLFVTQLSCPMVA